VFGKEQGMNIRVHYPAGEQGKLELSKKVADAHALAIKKYVEKLPCPKEQRQTILTEIKKSIS